MLKIATDKQIRALRTTAQEAGDDMQWLVCERALESEFDTDDYTGGGHQISSAEWSRLREMTQEEARVLCTATLGESEAERRGDVATAEQMETIRRGAYNETARRMARDGVALTYDQADLLGDQAMGWLRSRLGLTLDTSDTKTVRLRPGQS